MLSGFDDHMYDIGGEKTLRTPCMFLFQYVPLCSRILASIWAEPTFTVSYGSHAAVLPGVVDMIHRGFLLSHILLRA